MLDSQTVKPVRRNSQVGYDASDNMAGYKNDFPSVVTSFFQKLPLAHPFGSFPKSPWVTDE